MDTNQWAQDQIGGGAKAINNMERKVRPQKDQVVNCPRCNSTNTKFCYYNNYSLSQPRYFCKTCRRYWTEGGTLRNVPVGGGSRKNKRSITTTTASSSSSSAHKIPDLNPSNYNLPHEVFSSRNPNNKIYDIHGQDLNLGFPISLLQDHYHHGSSSSSRGMNSSSFMVANPPPALNSIYINSGGFSFQDLKPASAAAALSFTVEGLGNSNGVVQENSSGTTLMFPFGAMKQISGTNEVDQNKGQHNANGYWNGMLGGGAW